MKQLLVIFSLLLSTALPAFCPGEGKRGKKPKCVANDDQYKCGVFLEDLTDSRPLTWLGALPDALKRVSKEEYREILGPGIEPESFENFNCDITAANARCYATLSKFKSDPLDSCEKNLVKTKSSETVGDYLCRQVERFIGGKAEFQEKGKDDIKIPIYYSACGKAEFQEKGKDDIKIPIYYS